jgi:DNA-binding transcriptional regulator YhcF (GntR family)
MPPVTRREPLHLQLAGFYKQQILDGTLRPGDRVPSVREMAASSQVGQHVAQRAVEYLKTEGLVRTDGTGTYVAERRAVLGPQQRMRLTAAPADETQETLAAGLVPCPEYVLPILGLAAGDLVARREWVTWEAGSPEPARLSVTWCPPLAVGAVPELLWKAPLDPRGAAALIAERTGRDPGELTGRSGFECRSAKDDRREIPLLHLAVFAHVLAVVYTWSTPGEHGEVLEYTEFILPPGRVVEFDLEP